MALSLQHYCPAFFASLSSVEDAMHRLQAFGGLDKIEIALGEVADKHPSHAVHFGIHLLHRHCDLGEDEVMLVNGNATVPVQRADLARASAHNVYPTTWALRPNAAAQAQFVPLEFAFVKSDSTDEMGAAHPPLDPTFARDIASVLFADGMDAVLGLARVKPGQAPVLESTHGRANIVLPITLLKSANFSTVEVLWPLSGLGKPRERPRMCIAKCVTEEGKHKPYHIRWDPPS